MNPPVKHLKPPPNNPSGGRDKDYALVFTALKGKTQPVCAVFPIAYHRLKKELENRDLFIYLFNLTKLPRNTETWAKESSWLAFFENLARCAGLIHPTLFNRLRLINTRKHRFALLVLTVLSG